MKYVVDTHGLIWFLEGNPRLGTNAKTILADSKSQLILPAIALAEAVWIVDQPEGLALRDRARTSIPSVVDLLGAVDADPRIVIYPVDETVIKQSISLSAITEMHDRLIVAIEEVFIPIIAIGELYYGAKKSRRVRDNLNRIDELVANSSLLGCNAETAGKL